MTSPVLHVYQSSLCLLVVVAPVPMCLAAVRAQRGDDGFPAAHRGLLLSLLWCLLQGCVALLLAGLHFFTLPAILLAEGVLLLMGLLTLRGVGLRPSPGVEPPLGRWEALILACIATVGFAFLRKLAASPVMDYDSLAYHLPAMAKLLQDGSFSPLAQFREHPLIYYPYTWEAIGALLAAPFQEDLLVMLPNLVAWAILGLAIYCLARELGSARPGALGAAALALATPIMAANVVAMHVDLPLGAFFAASAYFAVLFGRTRHLSHLALAVAAAALIAGVKLSGLPYTLLLLAACAVFGLTRRPGEARQPHPPVGEAGWKPALPVLAACALFVGGFWYLRNWALVGNPLGLLEVRLGRLVVFPGPVAYGSVSTTSLASAFHWSRGSDWRILGLALWQQYRLPCLLALGIGVGWLLVAAAAGLLRRVAVGRTRGRGAGGKLLPYGLGVMILATGLLYWVTPFGGLADVRKPWLTLWMGQAMRYGFPLLAMLAVAAALGASALRLPPAVIAAAAVAGAAPLLHAERIPYLWALLPLSWGALVYWHKLKPRVPRVAIAMLALAAVLAGSYRARSLRDAARPDAYGPAIRYLDANEGREGAIGYLLSHRSYVLYGKHLQNRVVYTPWDAYASFAEWVSDLRQRKVNLVAVGPVEEYMDTKGWQTSLENRPAAGGLIQVAGGDPQREMAIFRVRGGKTR